MKPIDPEEPVDPVKPVDEEEPVKPDIVKPVDDLTTEGICAIYCDKTAMMMIENEFSTAMKNVTLAMLKSPSMHQNPSMKSNPMKSKLVKFVTCFARRNVPMQKIPRNACKIAARIALTTI